MFALSLPDNVADVDFLIANMPVEDIPFVEIQGGLADSRDLFNLISQKKLTIVNSYGYVSNNLLTNVMDQKTRLRDEVFDQLHHFIANPQTPEYITLDFSLSYKNTENGLNFSKIKQMHNLYRSIYNGDKKICLPVRVPGDSDSTQPVLDILRQLMLNSFRICLNIFPHELKNERLILSSISGLKYNIGVVRLVYEPVTGNYITEKFVKLCLETLKRQNLSCPIIFAPTANDVSLLDREIGNICVLRKAVAM